MKYTVETTRLYRKQYRLAYRQGLPMEVLDRVVRMLANGETLPAKHEDHALTGKLSDFRECHILPDWLLVYRIDGNRLVLLLAQTGTHADIFGS